MLTALTLNEKQKITKNIYIVSLQLLSKNFIENVSLIPKNVHNTNTSNVKKL